MTNEELIKLAFKAKENSYAPYSNFHVGAALLCEDGSVFSGCNIENGSFGATNCAERTAIFKAVSEGKRNFKKIAIVSDSEDYTYPCGICRQVMSEFSKDFEVVMANNKGEYIVENLSEILPHMFTLWFN